MARLSGCSGGVGLGQRSFNRKGKGELSVSVKATDMICDGGIGEGGVGDGAGYPEGGPRPLLRCRLEIKDLSLQPSVSRSEQVLAERRAKLSNEE